MWGRASAETPRHPDGPDATPDLPVPQARIEFDVDDVAAATRELEEKGYRALVTARTEPWGQVVTRLLGPEGLLVGLTMTPWMRGYAAPRKRPPPAAQTAASRRANGRLPPRKRPPPGTRCTVRA